MGKEKIVYAVAVVLVAALAFYLGTGSQGQSSLPTSSSGNVFVGKMVSSDLQAQSFTGANVLSDRGCSTDPQTGLSNCTTSLSTPSGILYFNYEHDMMAQPCLSAGDIANLQIYSGGKAVVTRTYWGGGGA